jgi:dephospho-CoA kinase
MAVPFVGLTGGLGAGKSTALAQLESLGAAVLCTDEVVHELYAEAGVARAVRERFGGQVFAGEAVDRAALAARVFANDEDRRWLEQLLWPLVARATEDFYEQASRRTPPPRVAVVEAPLLFEAGSQDRYDATIALVADDALRRARIGGRDHEALERREARQLPQQEKARRATYVVVNDGSVSELREQLVAVLDRVAGR